MPRTLFTDDVINRLCPEYQPLGNPNAYFDNVGGMVRSKGIKPTPVRAPPRPSRIQYLAQNSNMPLMEIQKQVSSNLENAVAQPTITQIVEQPNIMDFPLAVESFSGVEEIEEKEELEEKQEPLLEEKEEEKEDPSLFQKIRDNENKIRKLLEEQREAIDKGNMPLVNKLEKEYQEATATQTELLKQSPGKQFVEARRAEREQEILNIPKMRRAKSDERVAEAQARLAKTVEALRGDETIEELRAYKRRQGLELTPKEEKEFDKSARMKIMGAKMKPVSKEPGTQPAFTKAMEKEREATERLKMASRDPSLRGFMRGSIAEEE